VFRRPRDPGHLVLRWTEHGLDKDQPDGEEPGSGDRSGGHHVGEAVSARRRFPRRRVGGGRGAVWLQLTFWKKVIHLRAWFEIQRPIQRPKYPSTQMLKASLGLWVIGY